jgi:dTMP kinase
MVTRHAPTRPFTAPEQPAGRPSPARRRLRAVALVGTDGSGKTTQAHRLATELADLGLPATYRRNAGGRRWFGRLAAALGRRDAEHLLGRRGFLVIESTLRWLAIVRTLLRRAVTGEIAVMDRYAACQYASLRAHAAAPRPERRGAAERLARLAYAVFPAPDITFVLAVDPAVAYDRIESRGYDHETMEYLHAASAAYRALPDYADFVVINANAAPDDVAAEIRVHLAPWLPADTPTTVPTPAPELVPATAPAPARPVWPPALLPAPAPVAASVVAPAPTPVPSPAGVCAPVLAPASSRRRVPAPRPKPPMVEHARAIILAAGPLAAGASAVGYRISEAVQALP